VTDAAIIELAPLIGVRAACRATGRSQASHYRRHRQSPAPPRPVRVRQPPPRALSPTERDTVRALLNSPAFVDKAPASVYHELLDEGVYLASVSSMYRILRAHDEVHERRRASCTTNRRCHSAATAGHRERRREGCSVPGARDRA